MSQVIDDVAPPAANTDIAAQVAPRLSGIKIARDQEPTPVATARKTHLPEGDLRTTLGQIMERVRHLLDVEYVWVVLYDPERDRMVVQEPTLGCDGLVHGAWPVADGGIGVHVFQTGKPYLTNNLEDDPLALQHLVKAYRGRRAIAVPLEVGDHRMGVFMVGGQGAGDFTESDLQATSLLAAHLSVLVQNTLLLENERRAADELRELNQIIDEQRDRLQRTLAIHDEFTQMVLDGKGAHAIVTTLGQLLDNPVGLEDRFGSLISLYPLEDDGNFDGWLRQNIASGGIPQAAREHPVIRRWWADLQHQRRAIRLAPVPAVGLEKPRVVAWVVAGGKILGYLCVLESNRSLDESDVMAVECAATAIALQMMQEKAAAQAQYKIRGELVMDLLSGSYDSDELLLSRAAYLGIDLRVLRSVLVVDVDDFAGFVSKKSEKKALAVKERLLHVIEQACRRAAPRSVAVARSDEIIILAETQGEGEHRCRAELQRLGDLLRAEVQDRLPQLSVSVGIGSFCFAPKEYARSYEHARQSLAVIKASGQRDSTMHYQQVGILGILFDPEHRQKVIALVQETLGKLVEYDSRHGMELKKTIEEYLRQDGHLERTAGALHIHLNTLRYRLQRIEQITGRDLRSVEAKFDLQLALKVLRVLQHGAGSIQGHGLSHGSHNADSPQTRKSLPSGTALH